MCPVRAIVGAGPKSQKRHIHQPLFHDPPLVLRIAAPLRDACVRVIPLILPNGNARRIYFVRIRNGG